MSFARNDIEYRTLYETSADRQYSKSQAKEAVYLRKGIYFGSEKAEMCSTMKSSYTGQANAERTSVRNYLSEYINRTPGGMKEREWKTRPLPALNVFRSGFNENRLERPSEISDIDKGTLLQNVQTGIPPSSSAKEGVRIHFERYNYTQDGAAIVGNGSGGALRRPTLHESAAAAVAVGQGRDSKGGFSSWLKRQVDPNGRNRLRADEFYSNLEMVNLGVSRQAVDRLVTSADVDCNGVIQVDKFISGFEKLKNGATGPVPPTFKTTSGAIGFKAWARNL